MRVAVTLLAGAALAGSSMLVWKALHPASPVADGDPSDVLRAFAFFVLAAVIAGIVIVTWLLPMIGEWVGNFFFNPGTLAEPEPHADPLSKIAQGDYEGAVAAYARIIQADPTDAVAIAGMAQLEADQLQRPAAAAAFLEQALGREWSHDDAALLAFRLADLYIRRLGNSAGAAALLRQLSVAMPQTGHAARAERHLREIERTLFHDAESNPHL